MPIRPAEFPEDLAAVQSLFREYADSLGVDLAFQDFDRELAGLPGDYVPPAGALLVAEEPEGLVGCVALRRIDDEVCEMKRLYLRGAVRGRRLGLGLTRAILEEAARTGYQRIRLDTLPMMWDAMALYERLGFVDIPPYRFNPIPGSRFMERRLGEGSRPKPPPTTPPTAPPRTRRAPRPASGGGRTDPASG